MSEGEWRPDPTLEGRKRYWDGKNWTSHVTDADGEQYSERYLGPDGLRWQYGVVNIGALNAMARMQSAFGVLGAAGWELVTIYDKSSNWLGDIEKGFMLFKRPVPPGVRLADDEWCKTLSMTV